MKKIMIKNLKISNFKGIENLNIDFYEDITDIKGDNGTGKTTIADAVFWILYDSPYSPNTEFNVKPYDENGKEIHGLTTEAEITLDIDGTDTVIKKMLTEKWVNKKGEEEKTLKGNETSYTIDEIPVQPKQFKFFMDENFGDGGVLKILMNPSLFSEETHWKDKRDILLNIVKINDEWDTVKNNPDFHDLLPYEKKYSLNDLYLKSQAEIKSGTREKDEKTAEINALSALIKNTDDNKDDLLKERDELNKRADAIKKEMNDGKGNLKKEELKKELSDLNDEYLIKSREDTEKINERVKSLSGTLLKKNTEISEKNILRSKINSEISVNKKSIERLSDLNKEALVLYKKNEDNEKKVKSSKFSEDDTLCPTCGKPYDKEKADEIRMNFNLKRAEHLKNIKLLRDDMVREGKKRSSEIKRLQNENKDLLLKEEEITKETDVLSEEIKDTETLLNKVKSAINPETAKLKSRIMKKNEEIRLFKSSDTDYGDLNKELTEVLNKAEGISKKIYDIESYENLKKDINKKKEDLNTLRKSLMESEKISYLSKEAEKEMIRSVEDEINKKFDTVSFRLFETSLSGTVKEICQAYIERRGVLIPLNASNDASKIQGGIEIINVLSEHYGLNAPLIIDRRGEVRHIPETESQVINLYVSGDKELKITEG